MSVLFKEPRVAEISGAFQHHVTHNHIVVMARKPQIITIVKSWHCSVELFIPSARLFILLLTDTAIPEGILAGSETYHGATVANKIKQDQNMLHLKNTNIYEYNKHTSKYIAYSIANTSTMLIKKRTAS